MGDFLRDFFSSRDWTARGVRATALALAAAALTPQGQAAIASALGPYGFAVPIVATIIGALVAVGEKNPK
jgi:hypothetical protein